MDTTVGEIQTKITTAESDITNLKTTGNQPYLTQYSRSIEYSYFCRLCNRDMQLYLTRFLVNDLGVSVTNLEAETNTISTLATENKKRHTNTDSALGFICQLLDRLYDSYKTGDTDTPYDCCYIKYSDNEIGNYMQCVTRAAANILYDGGNAGKGVCATSCGGANPE